MGGLGGALERFDDAQKAKDAQEAQDAQDAQDAQVENWVSKCWEGQISVLLQSGVLVDFYKFQTNLKVE